MRQTSDIPGDLLNRQPLNAARGDRVRVAGKFFHTGAGKLYLRGATYGTFRPASDAPGDDYGAPEQVDADFAFMRRSGLNAVRLYTVPPRWLLDLASRHGLYVMVGIPWEQHVAFLDKKRQRGLITSRVRRGVRSCAGHPAVLGYAIGNEIPASIVRWYGRRRVEKFLYRLYLAAKEQDPGALVTYVNYPTTEYLDLPFLDFASYNVYLESRDRFEAYLARLQNLAGDRPLVMGEIGLDSRRNGEGAQAGALAWQIESAFSGGCAGAFVFAWTDEWYRGGREVDDWDFGLTTRAREPKPALGSVASAFRAVPFAPAARGADPLPSVSVVVCSRNGALTLRDCCEGLLEIDYPRYEVIVVDDGSTDATSDIAAEYGFRVIKTPNAGLSSARNTGLQAAAGEIVAYIDDDARPDPHWLLYLADTFRSTAYAAVGGPNIPPSTAGAVARCVANAPGGPVHVLLSDTEAEHIPGCNMAFRRSALLEVGGFDPVYRAAGDDVDICWRIQARGWKVGFNPAAVVFHRRRGTVRGYWHQQVGYGKAEALLERKWPEKYNSAGHVRWTGRLYGEGRVQTLWASRGRIYGGVWGSAPFQSVYGPELSGLPALAAMPESYFLFGLLLVICLLGAFWTPLLYALSLLAASAAALLAQAVLGGARARFADAPPGAPTLRLRAITAALHLIQPLARLVGRSRQGLTPWRKQGVASRRLAFPARHSYEVWREKWQAPEEWLKGIEAAIRSAGGSVERGGDYDRWDLHARGGAFGAARLRMAVEEHEAGRQLARFRTWPRFRPEAAVPALAFAGLAAWAGTSGAWAVAAILGLIWAAFAGRVLYECAAGLGALKVGVEASSGVLIRRGRAPRPAAQGPYRLLLPYVSRYRRGWLLILGLTLLSTGATLLQPWPLKVLVDNVLSAQPLTGTPGEIARYLPGAGTREGLLAWVAASSLVIYLGTGGIDMLLTLQWVRVGQAMVYRLARDLFARMQRRSLAAHARSSVGDSMSRVTTDTWVVHTAADNLFFAPAHAAVTALSVVGVMLAISAPLTFLSLVSAPLLALTSATLGGRIKAASRARRSIESQMQAHVHRNLSGMPVVQAFTREEHERLRMTEFARKSIQAQQRSALAANLYNLGSGLTLALGMSLILWVGAGEVLGGRLSTGTLLIFVAYQGVLQSQMKAFAGIARTMQEATGSAERVAEILSAQDEIRSMPGAPALGVLRGEIRLVDVTFGYEPERPVLEKVSLRIMPGRMVGIVGPTGGGKSTVAGLIARLYDPWQGRVEIDGQDVRGVQLESVREAVGLALQDPYLFAATVRSNIAYGRPAASEEDARSAGVTAGADAFIRQLPRAYDTLLGERGGTLSGGEQQRLSIARALVKNAPILILDEPTGALDAETEQRLVSALGAARAGKTTVVIAHRLSTVKHADAIIVIKNGEVAEAGTHHELMEKHGVYRQMYDAQAQQPHERASE